jgi:O-antigen/teichoic acid export membrane protein
MIGLSVLYLLIVYVGFDFIRSAALGGKYQDIGPIVFAWAMLLVLQMFREGASTALQALIDFKAIFFKNIVSATVVGLSAFVLSSWVGVFGAVSSLALGELILGLFLWHRLHLLKERGAMRVRIGVA